ncbi:uncharacterized protein LOC123675299 [Harmonia axyridis]|uniref:uncharacterized protein LOC123675299 n=1 Tax=Harmonia axyridis TaxID=115357 RepID=UPI001E27722E|nr:uncharacterized protein LOC123675299 [Harmonia axyridis]
MSNETEIEIKDLRQARGRLRSQLTRFQSFLTTPNDPIELEVRLSKIELGLDRFDEIQSRLEILNIEEEEQREDQETLYYQLIAKARSVLASKFNAQNSQATNSTTKNPDLVTNLKLPTINLPMFSGNYDEWITFHDTFTQLIDKSASLTNIQKFFYLKSCLKNDASRLIQSIEVSDRNYSLAWESLVKRYQNKRIIVNTHIKALFDLPIVMKNSAASLRQLTDKINQHLGALANLKLPTGQWDIILVHLITSKLDNSLNLEWENSLQNDELPSYQELISFLDKKCFTLETLSDSNNKKPSYQNQKFSTAQGYRSQANSSGFKQKFQEHSFAITDRNGQKCPLCKELHFIYNCEKFITLPTSEKYNEVRKLRLCSNCLRPGHVKRECKSGKCKKCNLNHNTLLHNNSQQHNAAKSNNESSQQSINDESRTVSNIISHEQSTNLVTNFSKCKEQTKSNIKLQELTHQDVSSESISNFHVSESKILKNTNSHENTLVLLSTAQVTILDKFGNPHICKALLDSGSQSNLITKELCEKLKLKRQEYHIPIAGINQKAITVTEKVQSTIKSRTTSASYDLTFLVLPSITDRIPPIEFNKNSLQLPSGISLADNEFNRSQKIDILLGANIFYELMCQNRIILGKNKPKLQETTLGWIVTGTINMNKCSQQRSICSLTRLISNEMLDESLIRFWKTEEIPQRTIYTKEEQYCEDYFEKTTIRKGDGRFVVRLPFAKRVQDIGDSSLVALKRLQSIEKRFKRDENLKNEYVEFMRQYEAMGHMTYVKNFDNFIDQPSYILPHHAVIKSSSTTTRCRVVFDGSAQTDKQISLNDLLLVGPNIQDDLFSIVTRLRLRHYVLSADVKMMFRQVVIHPDDRKYQRIIWRYNESEPIKLYELNTVTYGTASASYLATKVLQQTSFQFNEKYPRTCRIIQNSFYMDDLLTSVDTVEEALEIYREITEILDSVNFHLRKWCSNEKVILDSILGNKKNDDQLIQLSDSKEFKTLGISWNPHSDTFSYRVNIRLQREVITKRSVLAAISTIFDPLGLIGPATIQAKLLMRQLWQRKITWDEPLPEDMIMPWKNFLNKIYTINNINIKRHVLCDNPTVVELHGFSDASERAYGACIYVVSKDNHENIFSELLCAKSRVAPQGSHSLPRLELLAATLLSNLMHLLKKTLDIKISNTNYYSDSTIVLAWLKIDPGKLKTFVANRVAHIAEITNINDWQHVRTQDNPADVISRGINPDQLSDLKIWWHGPDILLGNGENHTNRNYDWESIENIPEIKLSTITLNSSSKNHFDLDIFDRYSSLRKLQNVIAYCIRFKRNTIDKLCLKSTLTIEERDYALNLLIRLAQKAEFSQELHNIELSRPIHSSSKLVSLNPFVDKIGLMRVGGRLRHSGLEEHQKHPIILPKAHKLTKLIVEQQHSKHLHAGVQNLLSLIRLTYWPIDGKNLVKRVVKSCITCFRARPTPTKFIMGELPRARVTPSRPFSKCGVDYAGPIMIKEGTLRRSKLVKAYISIFVCLSTRAVHIELVKDLTTDSFLNALKRLISRRGKPTEIFSDNGSNFVGANNHFIELHNLLKTKSHKDKIENLLASDGIKWSFIPSRSPHMGGIWEAAVKSTKFHLCRILGMASVTYEETYTILVQIEACLNSRPLTPLSSDPNDLIPLTPAHFLIGESLAAAPQSNVQDVKITKLCRYLRMQQLVQQFWARWTKDYLTQLQQRSRWQTASTPPKINDLVVLKDENLPPFRWPMARIVQLHPGADQVIRVVSVKVSTGNIFRRSISKICVLPIDDDLKSEQY